MTINYKIMSFRKERASELERMAQLLDKCIGRWKYKFTISRINDSLKHTILFNFKVEVEITLFGIE